jgi:serine kinase of HPr protein (carbohydrate metabolism regulator)
MVSDIVAGAKPGDILVTVQMHKNLIATANLVDVSAVVFVRDKEPQQDVIDLANRAEITLFKTNLDSWHLAVKLHELGLK